MSTNYFAMFKESMFDRNCAPLAKRHKISITRGRSPGLSQERM